MSSKLHKLTVRWMQANDVDAIATYWTSASSADMQRMGVSQEHFPKPPALEASMMPYAGTPKPTADAAYIMWEIDGRTIGFSSLKHIAHPTIGGMHLHMWESVSRGRGYGAVLFAKSAVMFYEHFGLEKIVCEPSASNPMPNKMLQKIGFPLVKTYVGKSSALSAETTLNCYEIDPEIARRYLEDRGYTSIL